MKLVQWLCLWVSVLVVGFYSFSAAQSLGESQGINEETKEEVPFPEPTKLKPNWWKFFDVELPLLEERVISVIDQLTEAQSKTPGFSNDKNKDLLIKITIQLKTFSNLKARKRTKEPIVLAPKGTYTLEEWLSFSNGVSTGKVEAKIIQDEIARSNTAINKAEGLLDTLMAAFLGGEPTDPARYTKGLDIIVNGSSLAVAKEKVRIEKENLEVLEARISNMQLQVKAASKHLSVTKTDLLRLDGEIKSSTKKLEQVRKELALVQAKALIDLGDSPVQKAQSRHNEQAIVDASVLEALSHVELVAKNVEKEILNLLTKNDAAYAKQIIEETTEWANLLSSLKQKKDYWTSVTILERDLTQNLLAIDSGKDEDPELRRINKGRSKLAGETILSLHRLDNALQDLKLLLGLLSQQLSDTSGDLKTWFLKSRQEVGNFFGEASSYLTSSLFKINETPVTALGLFRVIIILGFAWWLSGFVSRFLGKYIENRGEQDLSGVYTLSRLIHYGILGLGLFIALSSIGLDLSNLALVAGALSLGIGFGLQSIVNNFVSGLILLFERNIKIGNFIEIANGTTGIVKEINVRTTLINTNDNIDIILPNSELVGNSVINWTLREAVRRMKIPFGVAYGSDKELVKKAALEAADQVPYTYKGDKNRNPQVWLSEFGDSSLNFHLVVWVNPEMVKKPARVHAAYMWEIETMLAKYNIEIPFPQMDLHLKSGFEKLTIRRPDSD